MPRKRRKETWYTGPIVPEEYRVIGRPGKLIEKPSHIYMRGGLSRLKRVQLVCKNFGIYQGLPPRNALEKILQRTLVLVPAEYVLPGSGSRHWLVHLVFTRAPSSWRYRIPAWYVRSCYMGGEWILRLCITDKEAWLLASSAKSVAHCIEPLIAHALLYTEAKLLKKKLQLVAPLQVLKYHVKTRKLVYQAPYPWYYKIEKITQ